jgi:hypothetical protein
MSEDDDSLIEQTISEPRLFLQQSLAAAGREELFRWADRYRISDELVKLIALLAAQQGATVSDTRRESQPYSVSEARAIVPGTRLHIHLKKTAWAAVTAVIPLLIALIRIIFGDHSAHTDIVAAVVAITKSIPENFHLLDANQRRIYLAIAVLNRKAGGATVADLAAIETKLSHESPTGRIPLEQAQLQRELDAMTEKKILEKTGDTYKTT